jgi:antitoxin component YwqK of YwqJK toxin-antitoxin module
MKRIILTVSALLAFISLNAQSVMTTNWPNGSKQSEGVVIGEIRIDPNASKSEQEKNLDAIIKDGKWTSWFEDGKVRSEEYYDKGKMIGEWKMFHENGQVESVINFNTGKAIHYNKKGGISSEGNMAAGMIQTGDWEGYHENGTKNFKGSYNKEGKKDGVWIFWDEKGNVSGEQSFSNGTLIKK